MHGVEIMHESRDASEATSWEAHDRRPRLKSPTIWRRTAIQSHTAPLFSRGRERRRGSYKLNSAKEPFPHQIMLPRMNSLIRFRCHGILKKKRFEGDPLTRLRSSAQRHFRTPC